MRNAQCGMHDAQWGAPPAERGLPDVGCRMSPHVHLCLAVVVAVSRAWLQNHDINCKLFFGNLSRVFLRGRRGGNAQCGMQNAECRVGRCPAAGARQKAAQPRASCPCSQGRRPPAPAPRTRLPRLYWELRKSTFDLRLSTEMARGTLGDGVAPAMRGSIIGDRYRKAAVFGFERLCRFCRKSILSMGRVGKAA